MSILNQIVSFHIADGSMDACQTFHRKLPYKYYKNSVLLIFRKSHNNTFSHNFPLNLRPNSWKNKSTSKNA